MSARTITLRWLAAVMLAVLALACSTTRPGRPSPEQQRLARQGNVPAIRAMARWCADSAANSQANLRQAAQWWSLAAQTGDTEGKYQLGRCYEHAWGVEADTVYALRLYRAALVADTTGTVVERLRQQATQCACPVCAVAMARAHLHGDGATHDIDQAKAYYHLAAEQRYRLAEKELSQIAYLESFGQQLKEAVERQEGEQNTPPQK